VVFKGLKYAPETRISTRCIRVRRRPEFHSGRSRQVQEKYRRESKNGYSPMIAFDAKRSVRNMQAAVSRITFARNRKLRNSRIGVKIATRAKSPWLHTYCGATGPLRGPFHFEPELSPVIAMRETASERPLSMAGSTGHSARGPHYSAALRPASTYCRSLANLSRQAQLRSRRGRGFAVGSCGNSARATRSGSMPKHSPVVDAISASRPVVGCRSRPW